MSYETYIFEDANNSLYSFKSVAFDLTRIQIRAVTFSSSVVLFAVNLSENFSIGFLNFSILVLFGVFFFIYVTILLRLIHFIADEYYLILDGLKPKMPLSITLSYFIYHHQLHGVKELRINNIKLKKLLIKLDRFQYIFDTLISLSLIVIVLDLILLVFGKLSVTDLSLGFSYLGISILILGFITVFLIVYERVIIAKKSKFVYNILYKKIINNQLSNKFNKRSKFFWYLYNYKSKQLILGVLKGEWALSKRASKNNILVGLYLLYVSLNPTYFTITILLKLTFLMFLIKVYESAQYAMRLNLFTLDERKLHDASKILGYSNARLLSERVFNFTLLQELQLIFYTISYLVLLVYILLFMHGVDLLFRSIFSALDFILIFAFSLIYLGIKSVCMKMGYINPSN